MVAESKLNGPRVLLAFGARWCVPWVLLAPVLTKLEEGGTNVIRVDVDDEAGLAERYRITVLPTFLLLEGGNERKRLLGAVGEKELRKLSGTGRRR